MRLVFCCQPLACVLGSIVQRLLQTCDLGGGSKTLASDCVRSSGRRACLGVLVVFASASVLLRAVSGMEYVMLYRIPVLNL
jgi:hypothetical protein